MHLQFLRWSGRIGALSTALVLLPAFARPVAAQSPATDHDGARIESVRFEGVESVSESGLRRALSTQATRCRNLAYYPFCALIGSSTFVDRRHLDADELASDVIRARIYFWQRGYRQARVSTEVEPDDDGVIVRFIVEEGPPTILASRDVRQDSSLLSDREIERAHLPPPGRPLNMIEVDSVKSRLLQRLWVRGFADATVDDSVTVDDGAADLSLIVDPGRPTTVGEVVVEGNQRVSDQTIRRTLDMRRGEIFRRGELVAGQRRLIQSDLFRQAIARVAPGPDTAKQIIVQVIEAPPRAIELGVGFSTVEFVQAQANFTRYNWFGGARRLDLRTGVGNLFARQLEGSDLFGSAVPRGIVEVDDAFLRPTWQLSAELAQPYFISARNSLGLGVFARRRSVPGIVIDHGYGANASASRRLTDGVVASLTYQIESTRVEAGDIYYCLNFGVCQPATIDALRGTETLSPLGFVLRADRMNSPVTPTDGYALRFEAEHASAATASNYRFNRLTAEATRYLSVGPGVLAGRIRGGWVRPLGDVDLTREVPGTSGILHPRKRFYAGGARSVRGYGENQLGPRVVTIDAGTLLDTEEGAGCTQATILDGSCDASMIPSSEFEPRPLGGNQVFEANIEYRIPIRGQLSGVLFVDGAVLGDRSRNIVGVDRSAITPGFGFRYLSPAGPVRIDLGIRPTLVEALTVVTAVEGPDGRSRLVQLTPPKRYDPLEDSSGFLGQVLSRLQLHLSIGEAF